MPFEEPEPRAWPRLKKARKFFSIPFSRSSFPAFFLGLMISRSLLILGLSLPGKAASPISSRSHAHRPGAGSLISGSSESSRTPERTTFAAAILNCLS